MKVFVYFFILCLFFTACKEELHNGLSSQNKIAKQKYDSAFVLIDNNEGTKAYLLLNQAKDLYQKEGDSFMIAKCLVNMAIIEEGESDHLGSIETSLSAFGFLNKKDTAHYSFLYTNYNNLGVNSNSLKNYKDTDRFYKEALLYSKNFLDSIMVESNLASSYFGRKKYDQSLELYDEILKKIKLRDDVYYKINVNRSRSLTALDPQNTNTLQDFWKAKRFYESNDDLWGQDAIYCYLAEFYQKNNNKDSTSWYAQKMWEVSKKVKSPSDELDALSLLIKSGSPEHTQNYFRIFKSISDSIQEHRNSARNQFAIVRYESEKAKLNNLKLEKDVERKKDLLYFVVFIAFSGVILGLYWYRKRRARVELAAQNKVRQERLLLSKKVHDVVANGLYQVMSSLEHNETIEKEEVLDKLDVMYQKSRDISYDNFSEIKSIDFQEKISELAGSFQNAEVSIFLVGNEKTVWSSISTEFQEELYLCIRELLVNMKKHSKATRCVMKFSKNTSHIDLNYSDNGIGLPNDPEIVYKNGWKSIIDRISKCGGEVQIKNEEGVQVKISLPI